MDATRLTATVEHLAGRSSHVQSSLINTHRLQSVQSSGQRKSCCHDGFTFTSRLMPLSPVCLNHRLILMT